MKKIVVTVGCRPDCIKMMPLVKELRGRKDLETILLSTGQHRQMLDQVFEVFGEKPDYDLAVMKQGQTLFDITTCILERVKPVLEEIRPDVVLVHGDTSTAFGHGSCVLLSANSGRTRRSRFAHLQYLFAVSRRV